MAKKWMKKAFANAHGQFKAKAKHAGMSTAAYENKVLKKGSHASTKTKRQANLAKIARESHHHGNAGFPSHHTAGTSPSTPNLSAQRYKPAPRPTAHKFSGMRCSPMRFSGHPGAHRIGGKR